MDSERADQLTNDVWKSPSLVDLYLSLRGALPLAKEQIDIMLRLIAGLDRPVRRILDLGCGDGVLSEAILSRHAGATALLLDFSEPMLEAARRRLAAVEKRVTIAEVDYELPVWKEYAGRGGPFDVAVSGFSIHHQPDERKRQLFSDILQMLRPGGLFINTDLVAAHSPWVNGLHDRLFVDGLHTKSGLATRQETYDLYHDRADRSPNLLTPVEAQCDWLRALGYEDVDCYLKVFQVAVFGGRRQDDVYDESTAGDGTHESSAFRTL